MTPATDVAKPSGHEPGGVAASGLVRATSPQEVEPARGLRQARSGGGKAAAIRYHVLGQLEVVGDAGTVALGGRRQQLVLAVLLDAPGRRVSVDRLVDALWGDQPPDSARKTLQAYVSRLRRAVGPDVITTVADGYRFERGDELDASGFEQLASEATRRLQGDPAAAGALLHQALDLWRGPPYGALGTVPALQLSRRRLLERRLEVVELRVQADLDCGRLDGLVPELYGLVEEHPERERLHGLLMRALYLHGRQREALDVARRLRDHLADELGLEVSAAIDELQRRILAHDPVLEPGGTLSPPSTGPRRPRPVVGRRRELDRVSDLLTAAAGGTAGTAIVAGDAGVGKTRFVQAVAEQARATGWTVLEGACVELSEGAAVLAPVAEVLRRLARERGPGDVAELLQGPCRWLAPLVPGLGVAVGEPARASSTQVLLAFHGLLSLLAEDRPVLLVLEDLHWADTATRDVLRHLAARLHHERLVVVGTVRTDDLGRRHPLRPVLVELGRRPGVVRLDLAPLDREEMVRHLAALAGTGHTRDLVTIAERAAGNPFYAEELLAAPDGGLPPSLQDVLSQRLERLPAVARRLLGEAALLGRQVEPALLARVTSLDPGAQRTAIRAALDDGVLRVDGTRYAFRHALLREMAESRLLPDDKVAAHGAAAAAIDEDPDLAVVGRAGAHGQAAHHWWGARDLARCLVASVAAADEAERLFADGAVVEHASRAADLWDRVTDPSALTGTTRQALLLTAARAAERMHDPRTRPLGHAAVRAADDAGDAATRARATATLAQHLLLYNRESEAVQVTARERERHGRARTAASSRARSAHAAAVTALGEVRDGQWDLDLVRRELDDALAIARECDDHEAAFWAHLEAAHQLGPYVPGRHAAALRELWRLVDGCDHDAEQHLAHFEAAFVPFMCGDFVGTGHALARWEPFAVSSTVPSPVWDGMWGMAVHVASWTGRLDRALQHIDDLDLLDHRHDPVTVMWTVAASGDALRWSGQTDRALDRAEFAVEVLGLDSIFVAAELAASRAATGGRVGEVLTAADGARESFGHNNWHLALPRLVGAVARATGTSPLDAASVLVVDDWIERFERYAGWLPDDAPVRDWVRTCLQRTRAERAMLVGAPDPTAWDQVIADLDRRGIAAEAAAARLRRATAHAAADGRPNASCRADLQSAWRTACRLGLSGLRDDAETLAVALGTVLLYRDQ